MIIKLCSIVFSIVSHTLKGITRTKILFKFQIILKLLAIKSCGCLSELPEIKFEGSVIPIIGASWSAMC